MSPAHEGGDREHASTDCVKDPVPRNASFAHCKAVGPYQKRFGRRSQSQKEPELNGIAEQSLYAFRLDAELARRVKCCGGRRKTMCFGRT